jgi:hypothetical protein
MGESPGLTVVWACPILQSALVVICDGRRVVQLRRLMLQPAKFPMTLRSIVVVGIAIIEPPRGGAT